MKETEQLIADILQKLEIIKEIDVKSLQTHLLNLIMYTYQSSQSIDINNQNMKGNQKNNISYIEQLNLSISQFLSNLQQISEINNILNQSQHFSTITSKLPIHYNKSDLLFPLKPPSQASILNVELENENINTESQVDEMNRGCLNFKEYKIKVQNVQIKSGECQERQFREGIKLEDTDKQQQKQISDSKIEKYQELIIIDESQSDQDEESHKPKCQQVNGNLNLRNTLKMKTEGISRIQQEKQIDIIEIIDVEEEDDDNNNRNKFQSNKEQEDEILATQVFFGWYEIEFEVNKRIQNQTTYFYRIYNDEIGICEQFYHVASNYEFMKDQVYLIAIKLLNTLASFNIKKYVLNCSMGSQVLILKSILESQKRETRNRKQNENKQFIDSLINKHKIQCIQINQKSQVDILENYFNTKEELSQRYNKSQITQNQFQKGHQHQQGSKENHQKQQIESVEIDLLENSSPEYQQKMECLLQVYNYLFHQEPLPSHNLIYIQIAPPRGSFFKNQSQISERRDTSSSYCSEQSSMQSTPIQEYKDKNFQYIRNQDRNKSRSRNRYDGKSRYRRYEYEHS